MMLVMIQAPRLCRWILLLVLVYRAQGLKKFLAQEILTGMCYGVSQRGVNEEEACGTDFRNCAAVSGFSESALLSPLWQHAACNMFHRSNAAETVSDLACVVYLSCLTLLKDFTEKSGMLLTLVVARPVFLG